jgi:hypothetical protein
MANKATVTEETAAAVEVVSGEVVADATEDNRTDEQKVADAEADAAEAQARLALLKVSIGLGDNRRLRCIVVDTEESDSDVTLPAEGSLANQVASAYLKAGKFVEFHGDGGIVKRREGSAYGGGQYHYERITIHNTEPERKAESAPRIKRSDEEKSFLAAMTGLRAGMKSGLSEADAWSKATNEAGIDAETAAAMFLLFFKREPKA